AAAAGMSLPCQKCSKLTVVPMSPGSEVSGQAAPGMTATPESEANAKVAELRRQLKENDSQRTEVTSYINQTSIQLHRWQLRLQTLEERRKTLEKDQIGARERLRREQINGGTSSSRPTNRFPRPK